ncbi:MAG: tetratricopeptide repeat protein [Lentisphaeria bacterium]|nr:tetratricopeptide repeat protein [Lentisphaeria bacterium]
MKKTKIMLVVILGSVVLFACLGFLGYFGFKTLRRSHLRVEAREAFAAGEWKSARKLLQAYVALDPDSEEDVVRLAQVYRHFGNAEEEMRCWSRANVLNPLKPEYWDDYTASALKARDFQHLYASLIYKINTHAKMTPTVLKQFIICAVMTNRTREATQYYQRMLKADPEAFHKDDLGRLAEFFVKIAEGSSDADRSLFIEEGIRSDDPFVKQESLLYSLAGLELAGRDEASIPEEEAIMNQLSELNRFVGIPILADFYFGLLKFKSVMEVAEPYLEDIVNFPLAVLYAESCVFEAQPEKLKPLAEQYRALGTRAQLLASYFEALYVFSQGSGKHDALAGHMQKVGAFVQTDLSNLINLQVALNAGNLEKISLFFETIMKNPPFLDMQERARTAVLHYLGTKTKEAPELADDPRIVKIAQLISKSGEKDPFLMRIALADLHKRNMLTEQIVQDYMNDFPYDPYLLQIAAEFELFNGRPEQCLEYTNRYFELEVEEPSTTFDLLHMLALELTGQVEEATKEFTALVDNTAMNRDILYRYFRFCIQHERRAELEKMAERLAASSEPDLKALVPFFRAEALFLQEKPEEALSVLETAKTEHLDFALHAANRLSSHDKLDQALSRYLALVGKTPDQGIILANIAEVYLAKGNKAEALAYGERAWEAGRDTGLGQFVYAKMLAANGRYQDAEKILRIPPRQIELPDMIRDLWTDIMTHCVREDLEKGVYQRALDRSNRYLVLFPDDATFLEFKNRAEQGLKKSRVLKAG